MDSGSISFAIWVDLSPSPSRPVGQSHRASQPPSRPLSRLSVDQTRSTQVHPSRHSTQGCSGVWTNSLQAKSNNTSNRCVVRRQSRGGGPAECGADRVAVGLANPTCHGRAPRTPSAGSIACGGMWNCDRAMGDSRSLSHSDKCTAIGLTQWAAARAALRQVTERHQLIQKLRCVASRRLSTHSLSAHSA